TKQAEATRDLEVKRAEYEASVRTQTALAEKAYDISANQAQQKVIAEQVRIDQVQRQEQIKVQQLEVQRKELELEATVSKQAEAPGRRGKDTGRPDGGGPPAGVKQAPGRGAKMVAQVPELFETLTGQKVSELMSRLRALDVPSPSDNGTPRSTVKD